MSKLAVVAVFDVSAQFYHPPVFFRATGAALRWFEDLVRNPEVKDIHTHPDQFQLFHLGDWDDFSGGFAPLDHPNLLVHGSAFSQTSPL